MARADADERAFFERAIGRGRREEGDLDRALAILARHGAIEATRDDALAWAARARDALAVLPPGEIADALRDLAGQIVTRVS